MWTTQNTRVCAVYIHLNHLSSCGGYECELTCVSVILGELSVRPCWDMDQLVKQSLNSAWKQCSETFWILLTLASKHCLLLSASRLTTQRTKMPFMFFKEGKTLQADSEFPFNCGLSQTSLLFCCAINEKNWKDNAIMLLVSVKRFWSLGLLAIILYTENALEIERNYSRTFIK